MYERYYNLCSRPFQLSPDIRFFFNSAIHKRAMHYLRYGLVHGDGFIVITGDIGAGKTLLVKTLIQDLAREDVVTIHLIATQLSADDTMRLVASGFGLDITGLDNATILKQLESFMTACACEGKRLLLLVDEAQNLSPQSLEVLRLLSNYQLDERALLQVFLLAQPEFRNTIRADRLEQLRQRVIAAHHLGPLDAAQTRDYIEYRLSMAGWEGDPKFSDEAHALIFQGTAGVPRRINVLCDRLLLFGMLEEVHEVDAAIVDTVMQELKEELLVSDQAAVDNEPIASNEYNGYPDPMAEQRPSEQVIAFQPHAAGEG